MIRLKSMLIAIMPIIIVSILSSCSTDGDVNVKENAEINTEVKTEESSVVEIDEKSEINNEIVGSKNDFGYYEITQDVAKELMETKTVVVLDVREQSEFDEGHIENAVLLPLFEVPTLAEKTIPNKDEMILVYCRSGNRSKQASVILADLGYTNVYEFGGINTWEYGIVK